MDEIVFCEPSIHIHHTRRRQGPEGTAASISNHKILKREREKTNKMQHSDVYYQHCLNMFRASLCPSSGEQRPCVTACGVLRWFCWMVAVVGRCVLGCEHCEGYCSNSNLHSARTLQRSAPQPLPTTSSRTSAAHHMQLHTVFVLLKMGIMMLETC